MLCLKSLKRTKNLTERLEILNTLKKNQNCASLNFDHKLWSNEQTHLHDKGWDGILFARGNIYQNMYLEKV